MSYKRAQSLFKKYQLNTLSDAEKALVEKWLFSFQNDDIDLTDEKIAEFNKEMWEKLPLAAVKRDVPTKTVLWPRIAVAVCLFVTIGTGFYFYLNNVNKNAVGSKNAVEQDIYPGSNKAILTLSNGKKISLTDVNHGELVEQLGIRVSKTRDGQLVYQVAENSTSSSALPAYNTIETPRGGQYQVNLADGTKVWLNAGSVLKFPLSFSNLKERNVELSGEAYFEVEKNPDQPFIVRSGNQLVQVLGTHFNINSYVDEPGVKTTLLEGSIKVSLKDGRGNSSRVLEPGQQSQVKIASSGIEVTNVDPQTEIAWKNGQFSFENEPIENIMRQISRWYDVDIIYLDDVAGKTVWGSITRYSKVSKVLSVLERTGKIHFKVEGRRVFVRK